MLLRTRILLGYGYLLVLLLVGVGGAQLVLQHLARGLDRVLHENYLSVAAAHDMLDALDRRNTIALAALLAHGEPSSAVSEPDELFEEALVRAEANITLADEVPILVDLRAASSEYETAREALFSSGRPPTLAEYQEATADAFSRARQGASALLAVNQTAMWDASTRAREQAVAAAIGLGLVVTAALLSFGFLSRVLQQQLLGRLNELRVVTEAVSSGEPGRRARTGARDELGLVATCLNEALDKQHQLEAQMRGRLAEQRQVLVGLLARWHTAAAIAGVDGEIVASTLSREDEDILHALTPEVRQAARVLLTRKFLAADELSTDIIVRGRRVHIRALTARGERVVGWFATFDQAFPTTPGGGDVRGQ